MASDFEDELYSLLGAQGSTGLVGGEAAYIPSESELLLQALSKPGMAEAFARGLQPQPQGPSPAPLLADIQREAYTGDNSPIGGDFAEALLRGGGTFSKASEGTSARALDNLGYRSHPDSASSVAAADRALNEKEMARVELRRAQRVQEEQQQQKIDAIFEELGIKQLLGEGDLDVRREGNDIQLTNVLGTLGNDSRRIDELSEHNAGMRELEGRRIDISDRGQGLKELMADREYGLQKERLLLARELQDFQKIQDSKKLSIEEKKVLSEEKWRRIEALMQGQKIKLAEREMEGKFASADKDRELERYNIDATTGVSKAKLRQDKESQTLEALMQIAKSETDPKKQFEILSRVDEIVGLASGVNAVDLDGVDMVLDPGGGWDAVPFLGPLFSWMNAPSVKPVGAESEIIFDRLAEALGSKERARKLMMQLRVRK